MNALADSPASRRVVDLGMSSVGQGQSDHKVTPLSENKIQRQDEFIYGEYI